MTAPGSRERAWLTSLLPLLLVVLGAHLALRSSLDAPALFGDELHYYLRKAREDVHAGQLSLLPGTLPFDHRLRFTSRVYANLRQEGDLAATFRNIEALQIVLCVLSVAFVWTQARLLGLRSGAAALSGAIVGLFPWQAFHVHSLWPETLHTCGLAAAGACLLAHLRSGALRWLLPAGLVLGLALLAKAVLQAFVPVVLVLVVVTSLRRPQASIGSRLGRAASAGGLLLAGLALVVLPQILRNAHDGYGPRLSANRWWNLELGLTPLPTISQARVREGLANGTLDEGEVRWLPLMKSTLEYMGAAEHPVERERLARERTLAYVRERGLTGVLLDQVPKFAHTVLLDESCFEQSITHRQRWGDPTPVWLSALRVPSRVLWWFLLAGAVVGLVRTRCRSAGWCLTAMLLGYVALTVFLIPMKFRFFLPALPALALFASEAAAAARARLGRRPPRGPESPSLGAPASS